MQSKTFEVASYFAYHELRRVVAGTPEKAPEKADDGEGEIVEGLPGTLEFSGHKVDEVDGMGE